MEQQSYYVGHSPPLPALDHQLPVEDASRQPFSRFLRGLTVSQWLVLIYPVFLFAIARKRENEDFAGIDASAMIQIALTGICAAWVASRYRAVPRAIQDVLFKTPMVWMFCYCVLAAVSAAWSDKPAFTLYRGGQILVYLVLVADALSSFADDQQLLKFQLCFAMATALCWQWVGLLSGISLELIHTSVVPGTIVGITVGGLLVRGKHWRFLYWGVVVTLIAGTSSGSYVALLLAISFAVTVLRANHAALGLMVLALIAFLVLQHPADALRLVFYGKAENQILNGTGRVPTWDWLMSERFPQHPLLGFGFGIGEVQARIAGGISGGLNMVHMHSAAMSALLNLGAVGGCLLLLFWGGVLRATWKIRSYPARPIMLAAVVATILNSLVMESITAPLGYAWLAHMLIYSTAWRMGNAEEWARRGLPSRLLHQ